MIENNLISLQVEKEIKSLFKSYLELLEQIQVDHDAMLTKIDPETAIKINYLNKSKHDNLRKLILDRSNDSIRNILTFLDYFDFQINKEKVENAAKQRRLYSKTILSPPVII